MNIKEKIFRFIFPEKHEAILELQDNVKELTHYYHEQLQMTFAETDAKIRVEEELEDAEVRNEYLEKRIEELEAENAVQSETIEELENELNEANHEYENLEKEVEHAEYEINKLEDEISDLKDQIYELQNREEN